mmetsp:Transcript_17653/g.36902  ORF Transcript_17653/g.36902 Transcript_17653/m.36902 type:complete len:401 (-) Transcript_17653:64-1266(-)
MATSPNPKLAAGNNNDALIAKSTSTKPHSIKGIILIMLGSFSFSIMFLLVKLLSDMNTFTLVFYRSIVQIFISLIDLQKKSESPFGPKDFRIRFYLVLRAVFGALAVAAWFFGIQILPLPDAVTLQFTTPPFAAMFAVCMVGERWKPLDVVGAVVCLSGVALIAHPTWLFGETEEIIDVDVIDDGVGSAMKAVAVLVTTSGAAMAGMAYVCVRKIGDQADAVVMVFYYGVLSLPLTAIGSKLLLGTWNVLGDIRHFSVQDYLLLLMVGFAGYGGQWFTNLGLQIETAATATLATSTQIVWTFIFEILFLHETLNLWSLSGTALILGYMMIVGIIKVIENGKHDYVDIDDGDVDTETDMEEGVIVVDEKSRLLGPQQKKSSPKPLRYTAATVLQWQGSNSF